MERTLTDAEIRKIIIARRKAEKNADRMLTLKAVITLGVMLGIVALAVIDAWMIYAAM